MSTEERTIYQPIHPSIRDKLDPEYVAFHDEYLQYIQPNELETWDPSSRSRPSVPMTLGAQKQVDVGKVEDRDFGDFQVRIFTPEGSAPDSGWPVLVWLHGGGWVMGGLNSENGFLRHVCKYLRCAVITVNYRHAPEHEYPAATDDSLAGYRWIVENASALSLDTTNIAVGGLSAGGNLAAILSMRIASEMIPVQPKFQLLVCPVIDSTATVSTTWAKSSNSPWLTPTRMTWYREMYFNNTAQAMEWKASPCFATKEMMGNSPKTFVAVAECDLLAPEGLAYAGALREAGVEVEVTVYKGATHSVLVLAGIHQVSRKLVHDACSTLARELGLSYNPEAAPVYGTSG